jgi:DNA invertase Pin-like site-specific DNA recombinase
MQQYVAYYRVSTSRQPYGLEAQRRDVQAFLGQHGGELAGEYVERKSGKNHRNRPELDKALARCKKHKGCKLLLAKLDRVSRNTAFIAWLMEQTRFTVSDKPHATEFELHIWAALAQQERKQISERTKAGLAVAKSRGTKLGGMRDNSIRLKREADKRARQIMPIINKLLPMSFRKIAEELNRQKVPTANGNVWSHTTVAKLMRR